MGIEADYVKTHAQYKAFAADPSKRADKVKAAEDCRKMEHELANSGTTAEAGQIVERGLDTKRSLQEAYCRGFDNEKPVQLGGSVTTMRKYHEKRLLGK